MVAKEGVLEQLFLCMTTVKLLPQRLTWACLSISCLGTVGRLQVSSLPLCMAYML
jgi:hypothetical protein